MIAVAIAISAIPVVMGTCTITVTAHEYSL